MTLAITLLGPPRVERDGKALAFDTRKATALLAHLALAERPRSREALCNLLWPSPDPERARGALRRTLSTLRGAIGEEWLDTNGDSVALRKGPGLELDVERFRRLASDGSFLDDLIEAVELFSSAFMEGFSVRDSPAFDDWQAEAERGLERELARALRGLVEQLASRGDHERALPYARRWLAIDPLHEPAHRELIRLFAWSGDRAAALEQYRECVRTMSRELGVAPVAETAAVYEQVNDGTLPLPPKVEAPGAVGARARARLGTPRELPLVGRRDELAALLRAHALAEPDGGLAVIEGEAGIGKTRLVNELSSAVRNRGAVVLAARCHEDEAGLPYAPMVQLLSEAASDARPDGWPAAVLPQRLADATLLLPELAGLRDGLPEPLPLDGGGAQVRLLEGVATVITAACEGSEPGIVVLDDVHAADEATLDALCYLGRRLRGRPLLLVVGWRSEGIPPGHRLRRLAADLSREGRATIVGPGRLREGEVAEIVEAVAPGAAAPTPELGRRVYLESEGLPLFVAEYLAALHAEGERAEQTLRSEARGLLDARLGGLGDVARQVLGAAAVIGRSFDLDTVQRASGRSDEETVGALEELVAKGIVREATGPQPAYDFSHQKLRELVYEETGLARRRLLHARAAAALATGRPGGESAALVAQQLRLAGDHAGATEQYRRAAEHAASLHAHADALEHLEAALALGDPDAAAVHELIGDARTRLGDYGGAIAAYESAAAQCMPAALASVEHKLGDVRHRRGEWELAEAHYLAALEAARADDGALRARIHADLGLTLHHAGRDESAESLVRKGLALAEAAKDRRARAQAHNLLGALARHAGEPQTAAGELKRSLALARELEDHPAQAAAFNNLALLRRDGGDLAEALALTRSALTLCAAYGDRHREAALENNLADLHHAIGEEAEAMAHLKRAVAIFSEVGADEATRLPEIWKLVSW